MSNMISYRTRTPSLFPETRFFEDFMRPFFSSSPAASFRVDVKDEGEKFVLEAELPGVTRDSIVVDVNDGVLTIGQVTGILHDILPVQEIMDRMMEECFACLDRYRG